MGLFYLAAYLSVFESNIGGQTLFDTNQTARPLALADPDKSTLISDLLPSGKPNSTMANAHAEVGLIQQAYDAGLTQGQSMTIVVRGEKICTFCQRSTNLIAEASRAWIVWKWSIRLLGVHTYGLVDQIGGNDG